MTVPPDMPHAEFVARIREPRASWGVHNFLVCVSAAWGARGILLILAGAVFILVPAAATATYSVRTNHSGALLLLVPTAFAVIRARPNLNLIGCIGWSLFGILGSVISMFVSHPAYALAGALPVVGWFTAGAMRGAGMVALEKRIQGSAALYDELVRRREIMLLAPAPGHDPPA